MLTAVDGAEFEQETLSGSSGHCVRDVEKDANQVEV